MNISLPADLESYVQKKLKTGSNHSASEVIVRALYLLQDQDILREAKLERLRREINIGIEDIEQGRYKDYEVGSLHLLAEEIIAEGRKRLAARKADPPAEEE